MSNETTHDHHGQSKNDMVKTPEAKAQRETAPIAGGC